MGSFVFEGWGGLPLYMSVGPGLDIVEGGVGSFGIKFGHERG